MLKGFRNWGISHRLDEKGGWGETVEAKSPERRDMIGHLRLLVRPDIRQRTGRSEACLSCQSGH